MRILLKIFVYLINFLKKKYTKGWLLIIFSKNLKRPELAVFDIFIYFFTFLKLDKIIPFLETLKIS